jgi:N-acetylneuraminic acid mutarotase
VTDLVRRAVLASGVAVLAVAAVVAAATRPETAEDPGAAAASSDRWRQLQPSPLTRTEVAAARIGNRIYVVGGFDEASGRTTDAVARYSIKRDRWKRVEPMLVGVNHPTATSHRGKLYVHGGYADAEGLSGPTPALQVYNPRRDRWKRLPDSPTARAAHALSAIGNKLFVAAGADDGSAQLTSLEIFDVAERKWTTGPDRAAPPGRPSRP